MEHKTWLPSETIGFSPVGIITKLWNAVKLEIPVGYQDEAGFHSGVKPSKTESLWPPVW
jgi:hypothetical protein